MNNTAYSNEQTTEKHHGETNEQNPQESALTQIGYNQLNNNRVFLTGKIVSEPVFSHEVFGEGFYELMLSVERLSSMADIVPITLSERLLSETKITVGANIALKGQFRSYNKLVGDRSKLMLTVFVREILDTNCTDTPATIYNIDSQTAQIGGENPNVIELTGYVCKPPIYRTTPFNREICDILLAVNRAYNKSDYIPSIAWGRNARFAKNLLVGEKVYLTGRIQSREYQKRLPGDQTETRVAYEVSINKVSREPLESQFHEDDSAFAGDIQDSTDQFLQD